jgi:hypothetical protein
VTDHYVLNRRELTRMASRITASTTLVFSYQNVTVTCLLEQTDLAIRPRKPADHVSLSSIFNCQKTDEQVSLKDPTSETPETNR